MGTQDRLDKIKEHFSELTAYIDYFWKIMFSMYNDSKDICMLNPATYIDESTEEYIRIDFNDVLNNNVLLSGSSIGSPKQCIANAFERMKNTSKRPNVWFFANQGVYRGIKCYDQDISQVIDEEYLSVDTVLPEQFRIECMKCIKIDMNEWTEPDQCRLTVLNKKCIKEDQT